MRDDQQNDKVIDVLIGAWKPTPFVKVELVHQSLLPRPVLSRLLVQFASKLRKGKCFFFSFFQTLNFESAVTILNFPLFSLTFNMQCLSKIWKKKEKKEKRKAAFSLFSVLDPLTTSMEESHSNLPTSHLLGSVPVSTGFLALIMIDCSCFDVIFFFGGYTFFVWHFGFYFLFVEAFWGLILK